MTGGCGQPVAGIYSLWNGYHPAFDGSQRPSWNRCPWRQSEDWGLIMLLQIMCSSGSSNFCSSCVLNVIFFFCSNENWTRVTCSMLFQIILAKTSDQMLGIPSNIYILILSSGLNDFFHSQGRIRFEYAIHISGWAQIVWAVAFSSNPLFTVRVITKLASCMIGSIYGAILVLSSNTDFELVIHVPNTHAYSTKSNILSMLWAIGL